MGLQKFQERFNGSNLKCDFERGTSANILFKFLSYSSDHDDEDGKDDERLIPSASPRSLPAYNILMINIYDNYDDFHKMMMRTTTMVKR